MVIKDFTRLIDVKNQMSERRRTVKTTVVVCYQPVAAIRQFPDILSNKPKLTEVILPEQSLPPSIYYQNRKHHKQGYAATPVFLGEK
ncbi:MAG: hypothetical protein L6Q97_11540 [Thermoanaerobaculia bacterium]|nr:hypothetical protein [Thermoanaerobaculia bacterium]